MQGGESTEYNQSRKFFLKKKAQKLNYQYKLKPRNSVTSLRSIFLTVE